MVLYVYKSKNKNISYVDEEFCKNKRIRVVKEKKPGNKDRKTFFFITIFKCVNILTIKK